MPASATGPHTVQQVEPAENVNKERVAAKNEQRQGTERNNGRQLTYKQRDNQNNPEKRH